jgi:hypothetical protein
MTDHELDEIGRAAMRRTEAQPNLWPRLRPRPRPSLLSEALSCAFGGACALWLLGVFVPASPDRLPAVAPPAKPPMLADADEEAVAKWLATGVASVR